jgi:hypothetical protein
MRILSIAFVVLGLLAGRASAQWVNPYTGTNWNNPMSSLADTMIRNSMNAQMLNAAIKANAKTTTTPAATSAAHESMAKTDFVPGKVHGAITAAILDGLTKEPTARQGLGQGVTAVLQAYEARARKNNVAYALAFMIGTSYGVQAGSELGDDQYVAIAVAINDVLARSPAFANASASDREKLYEATVTMGALVALFHEVGKNDPASAKAAKVLAQQSLAMLGVK